MDADLGTTPRDVLFILEHAFLPSPCLSRSRQTMLALLPPCVSPRSAPAVASVQRTERAVDKQASWFQQQPVIPFARPKNWRSFKRCHD